jgi:hypothetical protein
MGTTFRGASPVGSTPSLLKSRKMTKGEIIKFLEPFLDDTEILIRPGVDAAYQNIAYSVTEAEWRAVVREYKQTNISRDDILTIRGILVMSGVKQELRPRTFTGKSNDESI